jgi:hypothetical protein
MSHCCPTEEALSQTPIWPKICAVDSFDQMHFRGVRIAERTDTGLHIDLQRSPVGLQRRDGDSVRMARGDESIRVC